VSGIVAALIARDRRKVRRQHVDDLAFPFVAPLRTQNREIRVHPTVDLTTKDAQITKRANK
jgi:hypothetical protein